MPRDTMDMLTFSRLKMQKMRRQVTAFWLTERCNAAFGDLTNAVPATDAQVEAKSAEVAREEGTVPSRVVTDLSIPRGGATLLEVMKVHRMLRSGQLMVPGQRPNNDRTTCGPRPWRIAFRQAACAVQRALLWCPTFHLM